MDETLNLLDFGINENGEYVNLVLEEKHKKDISVNELKNWVENHSDPLIRLIDFAFGYDEDDIKNNKLVINDIKKEYEDILKTKCYHYGNMEKDLYIFSLTGKKRSELVFQNLKHYLMFGCNGFYINENHEVVDYTLEDYLVGKDKITFAALYCPCFDKNGNKIEEYAEGKNYQQDIRHIVCIKEWQMDKFSTNRIQKDKKIKDFYEVEFNFSDLVNYYGIEMKD